MKILGSATVILACGVLAACQDLTIEDNNRPSLAASLGTATNVETSVGTSVRYVLGGVIMGSSINQGFGPETFFPVLEGINDATTFGGRFPTTGGATTVLDEPRATFDHNSDQFTANKAPWQDAYAGIAICHDVRQTILAGKNGNAPLQGVAFPNSARAAWFCKMIMGLGHIYQGALFDKGLLVPDDLKNIETFNQDFKPHKEVVEFGMKQLHEGIEEAKAAPYSSTLTTWINGAVYTNIDMAKIAYGYLARAEIYRAVTKEQREDISNGGVVDWKKVVQYLDSSLSSATNPTAGKWTVGTAPADMPVYTVPSAKIPMLLPTFSIKGISGSASSNYSRNSDLYLLMYTGRDNYYRMHHKILGPADTTGAYVDFLKTPIGFRHDTTYASPDRRLPKGPCMTVAGVKQLYNTPGTGCLPRHGGGAGAVTFTVEGSNGQDGNYFQLFDSGNFVTFNGAANNPYRQASYQFIRFGPNPASRRTVASTIAFFYLDYQSLMTPEEQDLLRAEAYMRLGNPAAAIPIINLTRTNPSKGGLPPITSITGVTQPYPQCVPHSFADAEKCGTLYDALLWEKRMEQLGTEAFLNWTDWRSFGLLDRGAFVMFPPSWREIGQMGLPYYTYGGTLPGSSDAAAQCGTDLKVFQNIGCENYKSVNNGGGRLPKPPQ